MSIVFTRSENHDDSRHVVVDVSLPAFMAAWEKSGQARNNIQADDFNFGGTEKARAKRAFYDAKIRDGEPIPMPDVSLSIHNEPDISQGRHRLAALSLAGFARVKLSVPREQAQEFLNIYGPDPASRPPVTFSKGADHDDMRRTVVTVDLERVMRSWNGDDQARAFLDRRQSAGTMEEMNRESARRAFYANEINNGNPVEIPRVTSYPVFAIQDGEEGYHRLQTLYLMGVRDIPVSVPNEDVEDFQRCYASRAPAPGGTAPSLTAPGLSPN